MSDPGLNDQPGGVEQPNESPQMISPGARLAAYRKERGWTVEQVASQLNLAPRQIVAIENDDYPALPGMPIVRGFVRAYAKLLKVDAAPLLATLGGETVLVHDSIEPRKTLSTPFSEATLPLMTEREGLFSKWVVGALLAVLLAVVIWAARHDRTAVELPKTASPQGGDVQATVPAAEAGRVQPDTIKEQHPAPVQPTTTVQGAETPSQSTIMGAGTAPTAAVPPVVPAQPAPQAVAPSANDALELNVREDSWVEVRRAGNNAVLLSRIVKAGERERIEVSEPVSVVIGNATGVDASLRGVPVELKTKTNSNVARLNLK